MEKKTLGIDDIEQIISFEHRCFTDYWKKEDWIDLLQDERATYYAIFEDDKIVGNVFTYNWEGERDFLKIMNLAVDPEYRKQGVATKLMGYVMEEFNESTLDRICAETRESNISMQKIFEKCGYVFSKVEPYCYSNPDENGFKYVYTRRGNR